MLPKKLKQAHKKLKQKNNSSITDTDGNNNSETIGETDKTDGSTDKAEVNDNNSGTDIVDNADELGNIGE